MKNKILTALLAALIAFGLWAYVITVERPESEKTFYNVPVVLDGEMVLKDRGLMITSDTQMTVTLKLSGKRSDLNKLKSSDIAAVIDVSRISKTGTESEPYDVSIPGGSSIKVVSRRPETCSLTVAEWDSAEIPVVLDWEGAPPDEYYPDKHNATKDAETVTITGPKEIIGQIKQAKIVINLNDRVETFSESRRYKLCDGDGNPIEDVSSVTTDRGEIRVTVSIQRQKDVELTCTVLEGGGLTANDVKVTMDVKSVKVAGSATALQDLETIDLGPVDLGELTESTELLMPIKLPPGVTNLTGYTHISLKVELPELETREYSVNQIRVENTPAGYTAKISNEVLTVKIRGRKPILDRLTPEHITAVVDLTGESAGAVKLPAEIVIEGFDAMENLGAVEKYWVTVTLSENRATPLFALVGA